MHSSVSPTVSDTPRVCLIAPRPPPTGGIARWTETILAYARASDTATIFPVDIAPRWRRVHEMGVARRALGGGAQLLRDLARFLLTMRRARPGVVHLTTSGGLGVVRDLAIVALARRFRTPLILHLHFGRVPEIAREGTIEWKLLARVMKRSGCVLAIDARTEATLRDRLAGVRVVRVANCVDPEQIERVAAGIPISRTVVFLGWVIPSKGVEELLRAWAQARLEGWTLRLVGPIAEEYRQELMATHDCAQVAFAGEASHSDAIRALAASSVVVLPSHTEGFPLAILEAMVLGKAIVASAVGEIPEMLAGDCGVLVPPRNTGELTGALRGLLEDEGLRCRIGTRARQRAIARYAVGPVFRELLDLWR